MNRFLLFWLTIALSGGSVFAQKIKGKDKRSLKRIEAHVNYLASDKLEGRGTGSAGELLSATYIAEEFKKLGLIPLGDGGSYFQKFGLTTLRVCEDKSSLSIEGRTLKLNHDFYPLSYSANVGKVEAEIVDCGFGIDSDERNDFEGKNLQNKIALIDLSSPDGVHPHSKWLAYHGIQIRVDAAIKRGAKAVIFGTNDENIEDPNGELSLKIEPSPVPVLYVKKRTRIEELRGFAKIDLSILTDSDQGHNVLGFKDNGAEYTVVIGAHHDHLGRGESGGSLAENSSDIHNGADDNASGTAGVIELAKKLKRKRKWNKANNYLFVAFSGEELGLLGSKYLMDHTPIAAERMNYMLNMDMIGMLDSTEKILLINGVGTSPKWMTVIDAKRSDSRGINKFKTTSSGVGASDHTSFYVKGVPAIHFFTGHHTHYHRPSDDVANLNFMGEVYVLGYMLEVIKELNDEGKLEYSKTKDDDANQRRSFGVTLGVVPDYYFDGEGMRVDVVREGKPGELSGMQGGDIIISMNGQSVKSITDYMKVLGDLKPGDKCDLKVMREGKIQDLEVQF